MKIFAAGIEAETNSFSSIPTGINDFTIFSGDALLVGKKDVQERPFELWERQAQAQGYDFVSGFFATAEPSGLTTQACYEHLRDQLLASLTAAGQVDIVLLFCHGAMIAQGYDDCEGDLLQRVRKSVGRETVLAVVLDLHCHLTRLMVDNADLVITLKEYPHTDYGARCEELFDLAVRTAEGGCNPTMAIFDCRMVCMCPTSLPTMRCIINKMFDMEAQESVLSVSFAHGFPFGDMPEAGAKVLVITDGDLPLAQQLSEELGQTIVSQRHNIGFNSLPLDEAMQKAIGAASQASKPVVIADQSDNPGGGAPGDATFALRWLLDKGIGNAACGIFYDPEVVKLAVAAGVKAQLSVRLGGKMGKSSGNPLDLDVTVVAIQHDYHHRFPQGQQVAIPLALGDTVALHCHGIDIVVSSVRRQCFCPSIFDDFGIPSSQRQLLIVKSKQHFYGAFAPIASEVIYMAGPGAVPPIVNNIPYTRMSTHDKFPWVENPFAHNNVECCQ